MRPAKDEREKAVRDRLLSVVNSNAFHEFLGFEMLELSDNYARARIRCVDRIENIYGSIHGGVLMSFADIVAGSAACMSGNYATTVSANLNFLLPATDTEYIYCESLKLKSGKHLLVFDIRITNDAGDLLDSGEYTYYATGEPVLSEGQ